VNEEALAHWGGGGDVAPKERKKNVKSDIFFVTFNALNPKLKTICYLLALLAHHFLHVSRIMVKSLPLRLLMSYIYIWSTYS